MSTLVCKLVGHRLETISLAGNVIALCCTRCWDNRPAPPRQQPPPAAPTRIEQLALDVVLYWMNRGHAHVATLSQRERELFDAVIDAEWPLDSLITDLERAAVTSKPLPEVRS